MPRVPRFLRLAFFAAFVLLAFRAAAESQVPQAPPGLSAANLVIDPLMAEWIGKHKGPGAVVVVVTRDAQVFAKGYGFADSDAKKPFTADTTLVRPGSISKLFTAIAVMQLVEAGKLDLDRDVNRYIDFAIPTPDGGVPVTLRRLLTHRAGFEEHWKGLFSRDREPEPLGRWLAKGLPRRLFPNGDVEAYSNYGFALAGYIVERVSAESYASYVQRHILDPLGMSHSTFRQPLPDDLAPLMAKGYLKSDAPPLAFFETIPAPAGGLSATATDMGRFIRALMNGGELDGVRILPKARLDEMMAPQSATPAGYLGLAFFGTKVAGHDAIGHDGVTLTFFSESKFFLEHGIGIFVSRDGAGEIKKAEDIPNPVNAIARRFLPKVRETEAQSTPEAADARDAPDAAHAAATTLASAARLAGIYQPNRRADSSIMRLAALVTQSVIKVDSAGNARLFAAIAPFGEGAAVRRLERNLYEIANARFAFVNEAGAESYLAQPAVRLQRVPFWLDVRWIVPALAVSLAVVLLTLLAWPFSALWRRWRKTRWSQDIRWTRDSGDRHRYLAVRLVLLIDTAVIAATAALYLVATRDPTILSDALDPFLVALYGLAWLGVAGAILNLWAATLFWQNGTGSRWSRVHHSLIAMSSVMIAWFFLTFHIAGTTLNY